MDLQALRESFRRLLRFLLEKGVGNEHSHRDDDSGSRVFPDVVFWRKDCTHDGSSKDHGNGRGEERRPDQ